MSTSNRNHHNHDTIDAGTRTRRRARAGIRTSIIAAVVGAGALAGSAGVASAAGPSTQSFDTTAALEWLCHVKGGQSYQTPMSHARCQSARSRGFVLERMLCEYGIDGVFASAPTYGEPSRTTWVCQLGPIN